MKYISAEYLAFEDKELPVLELSERNLRTLLEKLTDPHSIRTLVDPGHNIAVRAVADAEHYADRPPGMTLTNGHLS